MSLQLPKNEKNTTTAVHYCDTISDFPSDKFLQLGSGAGTKILILGESPAPNSWRLSGRAFYTVEGKLLPTGRNMNELLTNYGLAWKVAPSLNL